MSIEKSELKISVINEIGNWLDDGVEKLEKERMRIDGGLAAMSRITHDLAGVKDRIKQELDKEVIDIPSCQYGLKTVDTCIATAKTYAASVQEDQKKVQHRTETLDVVVRYVKSLLDREQRKIQEIRAAEEAVKNGEVLDRRPVGVHPGESIAMQRRREEAARMATPVVNATATAAPQEVVLNQQPVADTAEVPKVEPEPEPPTPVVEPVVETPEPPTVPVVFAEVPVVEQPAAEKPVPARVEQPEVVEPAPLPEVVMVEPVICPPTPVPDQLAQFPPVVLAQPVVPVPPAPSQTEPLPVKAATKKQKSKLSGTKSK
jgi:hypothetical protein